MNEHIQVMHGPNGQLVVMKTSPTGWMPCPACKDANGRNLARGRMWLGVNPKTGYDESCICPICKGKGEVTRLNRVTLDPVTGREIRQEG